MSEPIRKRAPGAGRKPKYTEPMLLVQIRLTKEQKAHCTRHGPISDTIQKLIDADRLKE